MTRQVIAIFLLALVWFQPTGLSGAIKLAIGHSTINPRISPLWIAQEKGYFQKYGIEATLVFVRNTPLMIAAMKAGTIPIAYGGGSGILGASVTESDLRVLATFTGRMTNNVVARPAIKSPKELRGKILGIQGVGGTNWLAALLWLEHFGLDLRRDNIILRAPVNKSYVAKPWNRVRSMPPSLTWRLAKNSNNEASMFSAIRRRSISRLPASILSRRAASSPNSLC